MSNLYTRSTSMVGYRLVICLLILACSPCISIWAAAQDREFNEGSTLYERGDHVGAHAKWRDAAEKGSVPAMFELGKGYADGKGVKQDYVEAMNWFRKAADGGNAGAMSSIGYVFGHGLGVKQDYVEAMKWFRKAEDGGDINSRSQIAWLFSNGLGIKQDYVEAIRLNPGRAQVRLVYASRAMAYTMLGNDAEAQEDIGRAVELGHDPRLLLRAIDELKKQR